MISDAQLCQNLSIRLKAAIRLLARNQELLAALEKTLSGQKEEGERLRNLRDGLETTLLAMEVKEWTK